MTNRINHLKQRGDTSQFSLKLKYTLFNVSSKHYSLHHHSISSWNFLLVMMGGEGGGCDRNEVLSCSSMRQRVSVATRQLFTAR